MNITEKRATLTTPTVSQPKLLIDDNYKFWIVSNVRQELKITPLCKALYILFLRYPAGISLYELARYQSELMEIYKKVSRKNDFQLMQTSIIQLVDRCDNSIHEKFARIKSIFRKVVPSSIADQYYIQGNRGEEKKIALSRSFIINRHI